MDFVVKTPSEIAERMSMGDFFIKNFDKRKGIV